MKKAASPRGGLFALGAAVAVSLVASATPVAVSAAEPADAPTVERLVEQGFELAALGVLPEGVPTTCYTLVVVGDPPRCMTRGEMQYSRFRRLARGPETYVCLERERWRCHRSDIDVTAGRLAAADDQPRRHRSVRAIGDRALAVRTKTHLGTLRLFASQDLDAADPSIRRAVIVVHGRLRNADVYFRSAETARAAAGHQAVGALLVAPQFLADPDEAIAGGLPPDALRWTPEGWMGGEAATAPAPISSFEALDALVARLADRRLFPKLEEIVVAGHSGGGQVVQRYAATSREADELAKAKGVALRFVVANPSSYLYFSADRPTADGDFAPVVVSACPDVDRWKYGLDGRPPYAADRSGPELEAAYLGRDLTMLLGDRDRNPNHPALDKSCAAEAQGPNRLERGLAYARYLAARDGAAFRHVVRVVPGVGHDGDGMFTSPCGVSALFANEPCPAAPRSLQSKRSPG